jgi:hypothetical protein
MKYLFGFLILSVVACTTKNSEETAEYQEWKEMQSFHLLMAEAFHPYKDSANLEPAKGLAKEMADEATKWLGTALPEKVDTEEMKQKLQDLNIGSQDFLKIVSESSADSLIAQSLSDLHHTFHEIQEGWYGAGKKDEHSDHH